MANELQTKLDAILEDKNTNLKPENLKSGGNLSWNKWYFRRTN